MCQVVPLSGPRRRGVRGEEAISTSVHGEEGPSPTGLSEKLSREILDYSKINLSRDPATLESLGRRLCRIGTFVERALGKPQDIEGAIVQDKIYLVQARPQQGLANGTQ